MTLFYIISSVLFLIGIPMALGLSAEGMVADIMELIRPKSKLRNKVDDIQERKQKSGLYSTLMDLHSALEMTGKGKLFPFVFVAALVLFAAGVLLAIAIDNIWLAPTFAVGLALLPFAYLSNAINFYKKSTKEELETALSIITNAYLRSDNIVMAVRENLDYIKPPLQTVFKAFVGDATFISSNIKQALYTLRDKVNDQIFYEWCTTLIQCQDDRTMKDNLLPTVAKLTDIRLVNNQLKNMMMSVRIEDWTMVGLVVANVPLLWFLNEDWFYTLMYTGIGKFTQGVCGIAILITALLMTRYTQPVEFKK